MGWLASVVTLFFGCGSSEPDLMWSGVPVRLDGAVVSSNSSEALMLDDKTMSSAEVQGPMYSQFREQLLSAGATEWYSEPTYGTFKLPDGSGIYCSTTHLGFVALLCNRFESRVLVEPWAFLDLRGDKLIHQPSDATSARLSCVGVPASEIAELDTFLQQTLESSGWTRAAEQMEPMTGRRYDSWTEYTTPDGQRGELEVMMQKQVPYATIRLR